MVVADRMAALVGTCVRWWQRCNDPVPGNAWTVGWWEGRGVGSDGREGGKARVVGSCDIRECLWGSAGGPAGALYRGGPQRRSRSTASNPVMAVGTHRQGPAVPAITSRAALPAFV
jgi:hypothetical protein